MEEMEEMAVPLNYTKSLTMGPGGAPWGPWENITNGNETCLNSTGLNSTCLNTTLPFYVGWMCQRHPFKCGVEGIATLCIGVFGVIGNIFTLLTLFRQRPRTSTVVYLLALAVTDIIFLITQTTHWALRSIYDCSWTRYIAKSSYQIHYINLLLNIWLVVCVSVDRYVAVCHPHKMATMCNVKRAKKVVGLIGFLAVLYNVPRFAEIIDTERAPDQIDMIYVLIYKMWMYCGFYAMFPLIILLILNAFIIHALHKRHQMKMRLHSRGSGASVGSKKAKMDTHVNVICVAVVILFLVCQLPFIVATVVWVIIYHGKVVTLKNHWLLYVNALAIMCATINSATNFLLYCAFSSGFRKTFLEVIRIRSVVKFIRQDSFEMTTLTVTSHDNSQYR